MRTIDLIPSTPLATRLYVIGALAVGGKRRRGSWARCRKHASRDLRAGTPAQRSSTWPSAPSALGSGHSATYQPSEGARFLTRDPLVSVTQDPYSYASNDPVNMVDPLGLASEPSGSAAPYAPPSLSGGCDGLVGVSFFAGGGRQDKGSRGQSGRQPAQLSAAEQAAIDARANGQPYDRRAAASADRKNRRNEKVVDRTRNKQRRESNFVDLGAFGALVGGAAIFGRIAATIGSGSGPATAGVPFPLYLPPIVFSQDRGEQYPLA